MQVLIDGKPVGAMTAKQEAKIALTQDRGQVSSLVLSAEEATRALQKSAHLVVGALGGLAAIIVGASLFAATELNGDEALIVFATGVAVAIFIAWLLRFTVHKQQRIWKERLGERRLFLPSAGTALRLDETSLTIGERQLAWPTLAIDRLELMTWQAPEEPAGYRVERLVLKTAGGLVALDAGMIQNGPAVLDLAYRRLRVAA
ncbi:hypothetical protein SAMN05444161_6014 [Rhizobiales bacterium GAS191]|nr:hypothetical protein SAMN05444161_6014 [Rhizobiales bacterium GAS191]